MNIAVIREKLRRTGFFIPFRIHFIILIIALSLAAHWLKQNNSVPETSRTAILELFITVTLWFASSILFISFITAFVPWLLFLFSKKNKRSDLKIKTSNTKNITDLQQVEIKISEIIRPLFGYIRLRLRYDENNISSKFSPINSEPKKSFFSRQAKGLYNWPLKNIKEYDVKSGIIYFEDFFQFFCFVSQLPANSNFFTHPLKSSINALSVQPKKTEDTEIKIEEMRKVQGEFLNYKNFENNDDVRRIVWKIYAKNKELVVRIPETSDPYASHICFYTSFFNNVSNSVYSEFNDIFLNNFKTVSWNIYEQLYKQNEFIKYIPDQDTKAFYADDQLQKVKYIISTSSWQQQNELNNYFNQQYGSVLCISSLIDAKQVQEILDKSGKGLTVVFVQLSKSFTTVKVMDRLQWLFVKPERKSSESLQLAFNLSPLKRKLTNNENNIIELLKKSECEYMILE